MFKSRKFFPFFAFSLLLLSGCTLSQMQKADMEKTLENFYVTRFEFGAIGNVDVACSKTLNIDGRSWNFSELLASVFQDAIRDRSISVGKLTPTKGGAYLLDELRVAGRTLMISPIWYPSGNIRATVWVPLADGKGRLHTIPPQPFLNARNHYVGDEAFYEGLKTELRPSVEIILDEAFMRVHEYGLDDF